MLQVPSQVWNRIAAQGKLKSRWAKKLFSMSRDEMTKEQDQQARLLEKRGYPAKVILAYQQMAPLLVEHQAISQYIETTENTALRRGMPEVMSVGEALTYSAKEWGLTQPELVRLSGLLRKLLN